MRTRREPPQFRDLDVQAVEPRSPRLVRVQVGGPELAGFTVEHPAASVRLLLPSPAGTDLVRPTWNGNEFLLPDGRRPTIRTFTPRFVDPAAGTLTVEVVLHGGGAASEWAATAQPGSTLALSGPGRGYEVDAGAPAFFLAGDETAIPAISELLEVLPAATPVQVCVELGDPAGRLDLPEHPSATIEWVDLPPGAAPGDALGDAVRAAELVEGTKAWVAGEAAAVQRIRRHLFDERGLSRSQATVRGYWKHGRAGDGDTEGA